MLHPFTLDHNYGRVVIVMDKIDRFVGEHSFLNNFHKSTLYFRGKKYPTVEHAYQSHKSSEPEVQEIIRCASDPMEAKKLGRSITLPQDWDTMKVPLMKELLTAKFENPLLRELLRATGDRELVHDNRFNDRFWGVCRGSGENWLGRLLEEVRAAALEDEG